MAKKKDSHTKLFLSALLANDVPTVKIQVTFHTNLREPSAFHTEWSMFVSELVCVCL